VKYVLWGILLIAVLFCIHRIAVWAEGRGWIYYRKRQGSSGALGNALLELQTIFEPSKQHVIEERMKQGGESRETGDKPKAGGSLN
jgi:hypothetical protein